jgi:uncharacterized protein (TIGR00369 family)
MQWLVKQPKHRMKELPHTHSCFVCGESNSLGLNLRSETDGRVVQLRFTPRPQHVGFADTVHGGILATILDEIMVWACAVQTKRFAFCAELNVRYLHPVPINQPTVATAELVADRRGRLFEAKAELCDESGRVLASATGKYLPIKEAAVSALTSNFVGNPSWEAALGGQ